jgi:hypothetical protein
LSHFWWADEEAAYCLQDGLYHRRHYLYIRHGFAFPVQDYSLGGYMDPALVELLTDLMRRFQYRAYHSLDPARCTDCNVVKGQEHKPGCYWARLEHYLEVSDGGKAEKGRWGQP